MESSTKQNVQCVFTLQKKVRFVADMPNGNLQTDFKEFANSNFLNM